MSASPPSALRPVFTALRLGLHLLVVGLTLFVVVRALLADDPSEVAITVLAVAFLACYGAGIAAARRHLPTWARVVWLVALLALWVGTVGIDARCRLPRVPPLLPRTAHLRPRPSRYRSSS